MLYRVIPVLLLCGTGLVKTVRFRGGRYIGDVINAVSIFNDKMVDELAILDINAWRDRSGPRLELIHELANECFMPLGYGGGITTLAQAQKIFTSGVEKVIFNTAFHHTPEVVRATSRQFGAQGVVVGIDVRREASGQYQVYVEGGSRATGLDPLTYARRAEDAGAGEIILQAIDREGTYTGYDLPLIKSVAETVQIPVVALGGARDVNDLAAAIHQGGAAAAAAGSMFVFFGRLRAILINTPDASTRAEAFARAQREATIKTQESFPQ